MPSIVSIIGKSGSGKTTLLEKLIPELNRRGYQVGIIKHHHQRDIEFDVPGKDSWRLKKAGALAAAISSPAGLGVSRQTDSECSVKELARRYFADCDIILTEGYKNDTFPKIEVYRRSAHSISLAEEGISVDAIVADSPPDIETTLFTCNDIAPLVSFIETNYLIDKVDKQQILLRVNDQPIDLNRFTASFLANSITGMLTSLRGCEEPRSITISITIPDNKREI